VAGRILEEMIVMKNGDKGGKQQNRNFGMEPAHMKRCSGETRVGTKQTLQGRGKGVVPVLLFFLRYENAPPG